MFMEVLKFNFEINAFALIINFICHFFEYSLTSFFNSERYLSEYRFFIFFFTVPYFLLSI